MLKKIINNINIKYKITYIKNIKKYTKRRFKYGKYKFF